MQKKLCSVLLLLTTFVVANLCAQSRKTLRDSSVRIIFNEDASTRFKKKKKRSSESNIIKVAPMGFISGQFPILYERSINDYLSIQGSVGLTHRNYVRGNLIESFEPKFTSYPWQYNSNLFDDAPGLYEFDHRSAKPGYMVSIQPRVYFGDQGLNGSFIGFSIDYYRYNFEIPGATLVQNQMLFNGPVQKEHETIKDLMTYLGWQMLFERISIEYAIGIGLRNASGSKYVATRTGNYTMNELVDGIANYKRTGPNFGISLKVGYHF